MWASLVDYVTGRTAKQNAQNGAAFVALVDASTGLPYVASGGGGGGGLSDTVFQDSTGQLFVYRDTGSGTPNAYKIPQWTLYSPVAPVTATSSSISNYALETGGNLAAVATNTTKTAAGTTATTALPIQGVTGGVALPVSGTFWPTTQPISASALPLPTGAATETTLAAVKTDLDKLTFTNTNLNVNISAQSFSYSTNNSTNGASTAYSLTTGSTWNGTLENSINQVFAIISVNSTQAVTLTIKQYLDAAGTIKDVPDKTFAIAANVPYSLPVAVDGNYIQLSVSNASGSTATLYVDTYYGPLPVQPDTLTQAGNFKVAIQEALPTGTNQIGAVLGRTGQPAVTPTVTASSAYTAGNLVGGLMTFSNSFVNTSGVLQSIVIKCKSVQTTAFKLYLFSQQPTNTTWTDKTAPAINALDLPYLIDFFIFAAPDSGLGTMTIYSQDGLGKSVANTASGTQLYGVLVAVGTPTFTSTSDVSVALGIIQD